MRAMPLRRSEAGGCRCAGGADSLLARDGPLPWICSSSLGPSCRVSAFADTLPRAYQRWSAKADHRLQAQEE